MCHYLTTGFIEGSFRFTHKLWSMRRSRIPSPFPPPNSLLALSASKYFKSPLKWHLSRLLSCKKEFLGSKPFSGEFITFTSLGSPEHLRLFHFHGLLFHHSALLHDAGLNHTYFISNIYIFNGTEIIPFSSLSLSLSDLKTNKQTNKQTTLKNPLYPEEKMWKFNRKHFPNTLLIKPLLNPITI